MPKPQNDPWVIRAIESAHSSDDYASVLRGKIHEQYAIISSYEYELKRVISERDTARGDLRLYRALAWFAMAGVGVMAGVLSR